MHPHHRRAVAATNPQRVETRPLASRLLRLLSTGIDFVALLTLYFGICASHLVAEDEDLCSLIPYALLFAYEVALGTSPAKQALGLTVAFDVSGLSYRIYRAAAKYAFIPFLVYPSMLFTKRRQGLHDMAAKAVVVRTARRGVWLRAILTTLLSGYLMLTFGCGRFFSLMMAERYDPRLANLQPEPWIPESPDSSGWATRWQRGGRVELPEAIDGVPMLATPFLQVYSPSRDRRRKEPSVIVMMSADSHPYVEYCKDPSPVLQWALPCDTSPRAAQKALFETVTDNAVHLDPRRMIGENAKRFGKSLLLEGDELVTFRAHESPERSVIWYALARYDDNGELATVIDYINVAADGPDDHYSITVFWSGIARQEEVIGGIIASFRFDAGSEEIARGLLQSGKGSRSTLDLLNALELSEDPLPAAEALYARYARDAALVFERGQFANWVSYRIRDGDLRFMDLNEKVWDWRPPEKRESDDN